jgi:5-bromo-4-chloroindolyl phosphate hydrolysis protein
MTNYTKDEFIKETGLSEKDIQDLKEAFVEKYATLKGWDKSNLTQEQLSEIYQQEEYKKAGLLFS